MSPTMRARPGVAWCAVALVLALGSLLARGPAAAAVLQWQADTFWSEAWRWWTAAFVHYSRWHLIGNLLGLALTAAFGLVAQVPTRSAVAWALAWPFTHLLLAAASGLQHYGGLSGVVHAGVAVVLVHLLCHGARGPRWVATALLVGLVAKLLSETPWRGAVQQASGWDISTVPLAHVAGVLAGTLSALLLQGGQRSPRPSSPLPPPDVRT